MSRAAPSTTKAVPAEAKRARRAAEDLGRCIWERLPTKAAILDRQGIVVSVNPAWQSSPARQLAAVPAVIGTSYPAAVRAAAGHFGSAHQAADGIEAVLGGTVDQFALDYRCDDQTREAAPVTSSCGHLSIIAMRGRSCAAIVLHCDIAHDGSATAGHSRVPMTATSTAYTALTGEFATSMAHELNQPLASIVMSAATARRLVRDGSAPTGLEPIIDEVLDATKRATDIVRHAQAMARGDRSAFEVVSINDVVSGVSRLIASDLLIHDVSLTLDLAPVPVVVLGDRVQLQQVVLNLFLNAMDAVSTQVAERRRIGVTTRAMADQSVELCVSDTGFGIVPDIGSRLFEPFVTSKPTGIGLGLSMVRAIVTAHYGCVLAESSAGQGAAFRVRLPGPAQ